MPDVSHVKVTHFEVRGRRGSTAEGNDAWATLQVSDWGLSLRRTIVEFHGDD
jgi:hypothetical protein